MGNALKGNAGLENENVEEKEEWLQHLEENRKVMDFSRKVNHAQYLKHIQGEYTEASLKDLPWSILETTNLQDTIDVSFNSISSLSSNLALRVPHLRHVNLSYNSLTSIPPSIALLFHLEVCLLRENKLTCLPEEICLLPRLVILDVSYNQLKVLPKGIGKLKSLTRLNISHNLLTSIPNTLGLLPSLSVLLASHNNCVDPPQSICNSSAELLSYIKSHAPEVLPFKELNCFPRVRSNIARSQLEEDVQRYVQTLTHTPTVPSRAKTPLPLPCHATRCTPEELRDRIIGLLYGAVLGDTLGVMTEYLTTDEINFYYGDGRLEHRNTVQDEHRAHFQRGKTTCVSDFVLLTFESMLQWSGVLDELELARRLTEYSIKGIKDLITNQPFITSTVVNRLVSHERFCIEPHAVALQTAQNLKDTVCEDLHALPMSIMVGLPQFYNLSEVQSNAARVCRTTHNHERVIKASVVLATIVASILQGMAAPQILRLIMDESNSVGYQKPCGDALDELDRVLDAAVGCLERGESFEPALTRVLFQGRQSRIYGCVCGGILGCLSGYTRLPARWIQGLHPSLLAWLNERLNHFLDMMGLP